MNAYPNWIGMSSQAYKLRYVRYSDKAAARRIASGLIAGADDTARPQAPAQFLGMSEIGGESFACYGGVGI